MHPASEAIANCMKSIGKVKQATHRVEGIVLKARVGHSVGEQPEGAAVECIQVALSIVGH